MAQPKLPGRGAHRLQLQVGLVDRDRVLHRRGEAAVGVEHDPLLVHVAHRLLHAGDDQSPAPRWPRRSGRRSPAPGARPSVEAGQRPEAAGVRRGVLHQDGADPRAGQSRHDQVVGTRGAVPVLEVGVAQVHGGVDAGDPLQGAVEQVDAELHRRLRIADPLAGAELGVDHHGQPRLVELHDVGAGGAHRLDLLAQDRHHRLHQVLAPGVGVARVVGVPHAPADDVRRRQRDLEPPRGARARERHLLGGDRPVVLDRLDHRRVGDVAEVEVVAEAAHPLGEHLDVALAPPLAVGDLVQAGALLQGDRHGGRPVQVRVRLLLGDAAVLAVQDQLAQPLRPRQAADDGRGEQRHAQVTSRGVRVACWLLSVRRLPATGHTPWRVPRPTRCLLAEVLLLRRRVCKHLPGKDMETTRGRR